MSRPEPDATGCNRRGRIERVRGSGSSDLTWWQVLPKLRNRYNFTCVFPLGDGWRTLQLDITDPVLINRRELVVLDAELEVIEETFAATQPRQANRAERRADNLVIKALAPKAFPDVVGHYYRMASKICASLEMGGEKISRETIAKKIKAAFVTMAANNDAVTCPAWIRPDRQCPIDVTRIPFNRRSS